MRREFLLREMPRVDRSSLFYTCRGVGEKACSAATRVFRVCFSVELTAKRLAALTPTKRPWRFRKRRETLVNSFWPTGSRFYQSFRGLSLVTCVRRSETEAYVILLIGVVASPCRLKVLLLLEFGR